MIRRTVMFAPFALAGCSALSALSDATTPLDVYDLRAPDLPEAGRVRNLRVTIEPPSTTGALDTDRIMVRPSPLQAAYLPDARWGETVPVMVQSLMLRSLQRSGGVAYVAREPLGLSSDVAVVSDVIDFHATPVEAGAEVRVTVSVQMVRERDVAILASQTFTARALAPSTGTEALVAGFDSAAGQVMAAFVPWALGAL